MTIITFLAVLRFAVVEVDRTQSEGSANLSKEWKTLSGTIVTTHETLFCGLRLPGYLITGYILCMIHIIVEEWCLLGCYTV
jgi:hypothetical protein